MTFQTQNFNTTSSNGKVKISGTDIVSDYLFSKLVAGSGVSFTQNNIGGNETITISSTGGGTITSSNDSLTVAGSDVIINTGHQNSWSAVQSFPGGIVDGSGILSLAPGNRTLNEESGGVTVINYNSTFLQLLDATGINALSWGSRQTYDTTGVTAIDWGLRQMFETGGLSVDWAIRNLVSSAGINAVDWNNSVLNDTSGSASVDWAIRNLVSSAGINAVDWNNSVLNDTSGSASVDWSYHQLKVVGGIIKLDWTNAININAATNYGGRVNILTNSTSEKGLIIRGQSGQSANLIDFQNSGTTVLSSISPLGAFLARAGSTTAGTAGIYLTSGALLTTAAVGAMEFLTDKLYTTITTGTARKEITLNDSALTSGRVALVGTNGRLVDSSAIVFNTGTNLFTLSNGTIDLGTSSFAKGIIGLFGSSSGKVTLQPANAAGTWTMTLPTGTGSAGQYLQTDGAGVTSWQTVAGSGTVTSVSVVSANGFNGTVATATTTPAITLTTTITGLLKGNGTAISAAVAGTDYLTPTGSGAGLTGVVLSVVGTSNRITSSGGQNPIIDISASYVGQSSITTLGTIGTGTWNATKIGLLYGGTNADLSATGGAGQYLKQVSSGANITVGTIPASDISSGTALTKTNDTNVTLTLGGSPSTALLSATSLTLGWTGTLSVGRGGTGLPTVASGSIIGFNALDTASAITSTSGLTVLQNNAGIISWVGTTGTENSVYSASPALTGVPTAPTATAGTNTTQIATTAFVLANAGTVTKGQATVNFGVNTQEDSNAVVTVLTANILTTSIVSVTPSGVATADHDADDYQWDNIQGYVTNIVNGVSFDIIGVAPNGSWGSYLLNYVIN